jgi:(5-formylfuran-3-yl)methyl phosphate synthase
LKLLISPVDEHEALEAIKGGADIIDVKNPHEGPLGASFPWTIKRIREVTPKGIEVSCTLGDIANLPGSVALTATGAASLGVNYVKASLLEIKTPDDAVFLMQNVVKATKRVDPSVKVVVAGFADAKRVKSIDPLLIPKIAKAAECDFAMVDTAVKDGKTLFNFLNPEQLKAFVNETHSYGIKAALAGSLQKEHLPILCGFGVDIAGLRGAACTNQDRVDGRITQQRVQGLVQIIKQAEKKPSAAR